MPYQRMYGIIFRAATDAIEALRERNYGIAEQILMSAQCACEEVYLNIEEPEDRKEKPL